MKSRKITTILLVTCLSITSLSFASVPYAKSESVKLRKITPTFDFNAIKKPVVGRIEISANRLNSTRVHVPAGTRAYLAGTFGGNKPALLAWYDGETKRLIAAVELHVGKNAVPTEDGVEVNAAAGDGGKAAALVTIKTTKKMPALLEPEGAVMLRTSSDAESYPVAPLLSFEGSSHLLTLSQPLPNEVLQSDKFDVRVQNLTGETIFSQKLVANGNVPSRIHVATTRTGKSSRVEVINSGSEDKLVALKPETQNVTWSDTNSSETRTVEVPAGGTASPGSLVSQIPGVFPLKYSEQTIGHPQNDLSRVGNWAEGPSVVSEDGNTILTGLCDSPVTEARTDTPSSARITPVNATDQPRVQNGRSSSNHRSLFAMGVSGLSGAGTLAVLLTNRKGEKHEEQVSYVPISSVGLADETSVVEIVPTSSTGFLLTEACGFQDEPKRPSSCNCECKITYDAQPPIANFTVQAATEDDLEKNGVKLTEEQSKLINKSREQIAGWLKVNYRLEGATVVRTGQGKEITVIRQTRVWLTPAQKFWLVFYRRIPLLGYTHGAGDEVQKQKVTCPGEAKFDQKEYEVFIALLERTRRLEINVKDFIGGGDCKGSDTEAKWVVPLVWNNQGGLGSVGKPEPITDTKKKQ